MLRYALTIFLSAFLLFQVQPLISKVILPWFGGTPAVWTTAMLFFQVLLLAGYAYAHVVATKLEQHKQAIVHMVVLAVAIALLPILPSERWKPATGGNPTWQILLLLSVCVGVPYFVLATTSPLMQAWFSRTHPGRSPYRLYALSNVGSLLALLSFPFVFEPSFTLRWMGIAWSVAFGLVALLAGYCAVKARSVPQCGVGNAECGMQEEKGAGEGASEIGNRKSEIGNAEAPPSFTEDKLSWGRRLMWLLLPACGSTMFLAVTNQMCLDVAVVPFLWILPLGLYLFTFVVCFDDGRWYSRVGLWLWAIVSAYMCWLGYRHNSLGGLAFSALCSVSFFLCFMLISFFRFGWWTRLMHCFWLVGSVLAMMWLLRKGVDVDLTIREVLTHLGLGGLLRNTFGPPGVWTQILGYSLGLFACCMVCHGELVRLKPSPRHLTSFYLMVSAGGALGGIFVSLLAPDIFNTYLEFHIGLWATCALALVAFWMDKKPHRRWPVAWYAALGVAAYFLVAGLVLMFGPFEWLTLGGERWLRTPEILAIWAGVGLLAALVAMIGPKRWWWLGAAGYFLLLGAGLYFVPVGAAAGEKGAWLRAEYVVAAWLAAGLIVLAIWQRRWLWVLCLPLFLAALVYVGVDLGEQAADSLSSANSMSRNFYGVLKVGEYYADDPDRHQLILSHGRINHGAQLQSEEGRRRAITYFGESSGIGIALTHHPRKDGGLRVGVLGLGTGTIAAYGRRGDFYRFYEINPSVIELSGRKGTDCTAPVFTYLSDTEADCSTVLGDGRLSLERQASQQFDILAMDAFSSDAVPVHLLTAQAFDIYRRHIKPDGVIAVNVTNRFVDLRPVVRAQAGRLGKEWKAVLIKGTSDYSREIYYTSWMLVTANEDFLQDSAVAGSEGAQGEEEAEEDEYPQGPILWTDDYSNLFRILK